ncbi:MAG: MazG nucleotide pyrophosphohydrolase domain-containing protein [Candidatus Saccharimonadales bacterium]
MSKLHLKTNTTLADIQKYVADMEEERGFTQNDISSQCLLLVEEVGELVKCIRKSHTTLGIDSNKKYDFDPAGEVTDILIMLVAVANRLGVDMEEAFRVKEEHNKKRSWQ